MRKFLSVLVCLSMILTAINIPFAAYAAEGDLFADNFESGYTVGEAVGTSKWNTAINAKVLQDGENKVAAFYCEGEQYWPAMHKTVNMDVGQTTCFSGKVKLVNSATVKSQSFYLEYRSTSPTGAAYRKSVLNIADNSITILGDNSKNCGSIVKDKWIEYNLYITPGAQGKTTKVQAVINAVDENSLKDSSGKFVDSITAAGEEVLDNIYVYQNKKANMVHNNFINDTTTAMNYLDDVRIYNVGANLFDDNAKYIKINGSEVAGFDADKTEYSVILPFETESATVEAAANSDKASVSISESMVSEFPKTVTITITSEGNTVKTYTLKLRRKTSAVEMDSKLVDVKDNKDAILTMVYDDGHVKTAEFNQDMFEKYGLRGTSVIITNQMTGNTLARMQAVVQKGLIDVTSHSTTHKAIDASYNTAENLEYELVDSRDYLTEKFPTVDTLTFAPSNNTITAEGWEVVKETYWAMRSGNRGFNTLSPEDGTAAGQWYNLYMQGIGDVATIAQRNAWIDNVISRKGWLIEMWHGIEEGGYQQQTKSDAEAHYQYISKKQDEGKIAVMTFNEATKYIRERQISASEAYMVDDNCVGVNVTYDTNLLPKDIFDYPLTVKVEIPDGWGAVSVVEDGKTKVKTAFVEDGKTYAYANVVPNGEACTLTKVEKSGKVNNIRLNGESLKGFDPDTTTYNIEAEASELPISVTAEKQDMNASVSIDKEEITTLPAQCVITVADAEGGESTYTLNISRAKSTDATLKSVLVDDVAIKGFSPSVLAYRVKTDEEQKTVVKAVANDSQYATVSYSVNSVVSQGESVEATLPATVTIIVKAENGAEKKYTVTVESNSGDVLYINDDFESYTDGNLVDQSQWDGTNFSEVSGVKAIKDPDNDKNMLGYAFNVKGSAENQQLNKYIGAATSETVVVSGKLKGLAHDTSSVTEFFVRGDGINLVTIGNIFNNGTIKVGRTTADFGYENGKWLNYVFVIKPGDKKYNVDAYFYGEGVGNETHKVSAVTTDNTAADLSAMNCRILVRGYVNSGEGNGIYFDDIKVYSPGKFMIFMDDSEDVNLADVGKLVVRANHEIDEATFDKNSVKVTNASGGEAVVEEVNATPNGFEVKLSADTADGDYTLSLTEAAKDIVGQSVANSIKFNVKNTAYDAITGLALGSNGTLNQPYDNMTEVKFTATPTPSVNVNERQICWYVNDVLQMGASGKEFKFTPSECGKTYSVYAKAGSVESEKITITVGEHPIENITAINITSQGVLNQTINAMGKVAFAANTTPSEYVDVSKIDWYVNGEKVYSGKTFEYTPSGLGMYEVCAKFGTSVVSNVISVNVTEKEIAADVYLATPETFESYKIGDVIYGNSANNSGFNVKGDSVNKYGQAWVDGADQLQYSCFIAKADYKSVYFTGKYMYNSKESTSFNLWFRGAKYNKPFETRGDNGRVNFYGSGFTVLEPDKWVKFIVILNPNEADITKSTARLIFTGDGVKDADYAISELKTVDLSNIYANNVRYMLQFYTDNNLYVDDIYLFNSSSFIATVAEKDVTETSVKVMFNHEVMPDTLKKENIFVSDKDGKNVEIESIEFDYTDLKYVTIKFKNKLAANENYKVSFGENLKDIAGICADTAPVFKLKSKEASVGITLSTNGTSISVNGENVESSAVKEYIVGSTLSLSADGEGTFMYWKDATSGAIVSYNKNYEFKVGSARSLVAVFADNADVYVTFKNANNSVIAEGLASAVVVPQNPYIYGYEFAGWYVGSDKANISAGDTLGSLTANTTYNAGYTKSETKYDVTVNGVSAKYAYNDKVTVTANAEKDGKTFAYWTKDGAIASYSATYSFYVSGATTLEAVYGVSTSDKNVLVMAAPVMVGADKIAFFAERNIDDANSVIESGILLGTTAGLTLETVTLKAVATSQSNAGQFTVRKASVANGDTWYGRAYVIYRDAAGNVNTIYSNEVSKTAE